MNADGSDKSVRVLGGHGHTTYYPPDFWSWGNKMAIAKGEKKRKGRKEKGRKGRKKGKERVVKRGMG